MGKLKDYFERIYVINLSIKPERRDRLVQNLESAELAEEKDLTWAKAILGDWCWPPEYFKAGNGAWGCHQSHLRVVQEAIMDEVENYLILEDDACFHPDAADHLDRLMSELPSDWDQLYLGGQHLQEPSEVEGSPFVFRCHNVNRTHAFALNRKAFVHFQRHITHAPDYMANPDFHIDHQLGLAHERGAWNTYAPTWWLAGQEAGSSNISGRQTPRYWWHYSGYSKGLPFCFFDSNPDQADRDGWHQYLHFGNYLKEGSFEDHGLDRCVGVPHELERWLKMIAREAMDHWKIPAIYHPKISREEVARLWKSGLVDSDQELLNQLVNYPGNGLFPHPLNGAGECFGNTIRRTSAA